MNKFLQQLGLQKQDPKELAKEWQRKLRAEKRVIERQIREIEREQSKLETEIKALAKKGGQQQSLRILAKEIVQSRKAIERLHVAIANINSVSLQIKTMASTAVMTQTMKASTETMKAMNRLMNTPELQSNMRELGVEMEKAGFMEELVNDALDDMDPQTDEIVDGEVEKVITEATLGKLNSVPVAQKGANLFRNSIDREDEEEESQINQLEQRLKNLS